MAGQIAKGSLEEIGIPFTYLWNRIGDRVATDRLRILGRAARAASRLRRARLGVIGNVSWGMLTAMPDPQAVLRELGPELVHYDQLTLIRRMEEIPETDALAFLRGRLDGVELDEGVLERDLVNAGRMTLALEQIVAELQLDAVTVKCHTALSSDYGSTACLALSLISDEAEGMCEGDVLQLASQLVLREITATASVHADLQDVTEDAVACGGCGLSPLGLCDSPRLAAYRGHFQGLHVVSPWRAGRVTLARLGRRRGKSGHRLHVAGGRMTADGAIRGEAFGHATVAGGWVRPDVGVDGFIQTSIGNHYALTWEDCRAEVRALAGMIGVELIET